MIYNIKNILKKLGFCVEDIENIAQNIYKTYTSPKRYYHDINHISNMLSKFDDFIQHSNQIQKIKNIPSGFRRDFFMQKKKECFHTPFLFSV